MKRVSSLPTWADMYQDVLQAVLFVFSQHITTLSLDVSACSLPTATPAPDFDPAARPAAQRFIRRRIKLLRNLLLWRRLAQGEIRDLIGRVVRELVLPVLSKAWDSGGKELAGQVSVVAAWAVLRVVSKVLDTFSSFVFQLMDRFSWQAVAF